MMEHAQVRFFSNADSRAIEGSHDGRSPEEEERFEATKRNLPGQSGQRQDGAQQGTRTGLLCGSFVAQASKQTKRKQLTRRLCSQLMQTSEPGDKAHMKRSHKRRSSAALLLID